MAKSIKETITNEDNTIISTTVKIPNILKNLDSQVALISLSQNIQNAPLIDELVIHELTYEKGQSSTSLGFRAFKTAIENHSINIESEVREYLDTQDLSQDVLQKDLATVLNIAHHAREQVSTIEAILIFIVKNCKLTQSYIFRALQYVRYPMKLSYQEMTKFL